MPAKVNWKLGSMKFYLILWIRLLHLWIEGHRAPRKSTCFQQVPLLPLRMDNNDKNKATAFLHFKERTQNSWEYHVEMMWGWNCMETKNHLEAWIVMSALKFDELKYLISDSFLCVNFNSLHAAGVVETDCSNLSWLRQLIEKKGTGYCSK